jgi:hypothetical protein
MLIAEKLSKQQLHDFEEMNEEDFEAGEARPLIPAGSYGVQCIGVEKGIFCFGSFKIFLKFKITNPSIYKDTELFMAMNQYKKVPPGSKYYEQWVIANGNIRPARQDRMSPAIFKGHFFEAVARIVKPKFKDGAEKHDSFNYSIIDYLKARIT